MSIRDEVKRKAVEWLGDPRILQLLQNEQVIRLLSALAQVPGVLTSITTEQSDRIAHTFGLATAEEVAALRRQIERLERELAQTKAQLGVHK